MRGPLSAPHAGPVRAPFATRLRSALSRRTKPHVASTVRGASPSVEERTHAARAGNRSSGERDISSGKGPGPQPLLARVAPTPGGSRGSHLTRPADAPGDPGHVASDPKVARFDEGEIRAGPTRRTTGPGRSRVGFSKGEAADPPFHPYPRVVRRARAGVLLLIPFGGL